MLIDLSHMTIKTFFIGITHVLQFQTREKYNNNRKPNCLEVEAQ